MILSHRLTKTVAALHDSNGLSCSLKISQKMKLHKLLLLFAALTFTASCGGDDPILPPGEDGGNNEQPGGEEELDAEAKAIVSRMETPEILRDGSTLLICHTSSETVNGAKKDVVTYTIEYDKKEYHSRWVAFRFDSATRKKNVSRSGSFMDDPLLPSDCQIGSSSYSGYDRGHLCASADRLYSHDANQNTFYMSNMSPQLSSFNQGYWVTLEGLVQKLGRNEGFSDTLYVVKGGRIWTSFCRITTSLKRPGSMFCSWLTSLPL